MAGDTDGGIEAKPRRREGVVVHVVPSKREGPRWVLEDAWNGRYVDLRGGERDAFIWERLDGTRTLHEVSLEFLDEHGALPRDLAGLVARLAEEGLIEGAAAVPTERAALSKLGARVPIPGFGALLSLFAVPLSPFARSPLVLLLLLAGTAGLVLATYERTLVGLRGTFLELDHVAWRGVVAVVFLNFLASCLESLLRAAVLRRGSRVREAGLALPFGLPGVYIDEAPALLLPVERRVLVQLAPLAVALALGGGACIAIFELAQRGGASPRLLELLGKVAWVGLLRALFHANPIGPSGLASAIATWSGVENLSGASRRFFTHGIFQSDGLLDGLDARERLLVAHGVASLAWLIVAARTLGWVVVGEVLPPFQSALHAANSVNMAALLVPLALACVPLVLIVGALAVALARALLRAASSSPVLSSPRGAASLVAIVALLLAVQTSQVAASHASAHAAVVGLLAALLAFRVPSEDGKGRAAFAITTVALAAAIETFAAIFVADAASQGEIRETLRRGLAWMHTGARFLLLAGACLELGTASRIGTFATPLGFLAALAGVGALALPFAAQDKRLPPFFVDPAIALGAALFYLTALVASLGSARATSRAYFTLAALGFGAARVLPALEHAPPNVRDQLRLPPWLPPSSLERALVTLALGLLAAALVARGREKKVRRYNVPVVLSDDRTAKGVFEHILASAPHQADAHLGRGAADIIEARLDSKNPAKSTEEWAARALKAARATAGERWLSRFIEGALARVPSAERARVGRALALIGPLEAVGLRAQDGAGPEDPVRVQLFRSVPILGPLPDRDAKELALLAVREHAELGDVVVRQGDEGDRLYVIAKGEAQVSIHGKDGRERTVAHLREGDSFGEGALLRHEPRAATVTASGPMDLLVVDRDVFLDFMRERKDLLEKLLDRLEDVWMVRSMGIFSELDGSQVTHLFQRFKTLKAKKGAAIIQQGDRGDRFFVVREGELAVEVAAASDKREIATLARGDYFGEMALLHDAPRAATVRATSDVELLALERNDFLRSVAGRGRARVEQASSKRAQELGP